MKEKKKNNKPNPAGIAINDKYSATCKELQQEDEKDYIYIGCVL